MSELCKVLGSSPRVRAQTKRGSDVRAAISQDRRSSDRRRRRMWLGPWIQHDRGAEWGEDALKKKLWDENEMKHVTSIWWEDPSSHISASDTAIRGTRERPPVLISHKTADKIICGFFSWEAAKRLNKRWCVETQEWKKRSFYFIWNHLEAFL